MERHNIYSDQNQLTSWPETVANLQDLFPPFPMDGYQFTVAGLPYDAYVTSDNDPNPTSETRLFENHSGLEVEMVHILSEVLVMFWCKWEL